MDIKKQLGSKIRGMRKERRMSQEKLAKKSTLHRTYISTVENGLKNISVENIAKIAGALDIDVKDLFD